MVFDQFLKELLHELILIIGKLWSKFDHPMITNFHRNIAAGPIDFQNQHSITKINEICDVKGSSVFIDVNGIGVFFYVGSSVCIILSVKLDW